MSSRKELSTSERLKLKKTTNMLLRSSGSSNSLLSKTAPQTKPTNLLMSRTAKASISSSTSLSAAASSSSAAAAAAAAATTITMPVQQTLTLTNVSIKKLKNKFPLFCSTMNLTPADFLTATQRSDIWYMKLIEQIFDAATLEANKYVAPGKHREIGGINMGAMDAFPLVASRFIANKYSVMEIRGRTCVELLSAVLRAVDLEQGLYGNQILPEFASTNFRATIFANMLSELYEPDTVAVFLHHRLMFQTFCEISLSDLIVPHAVDEYAATDSSSSNNKQHTNSTIGASAAITSSNTFTDTNQSEMNVNMNSTTFNNITTTATATTSTTTTMNDKKLFVELPEIPTQRGRKSLYFLSDISFPDVPVIAFDISLLPTVCLLSLPGSPLKIRTYLAGRILEESSRQAQQAMAVAVSQRGVSEAEIDPENKLTDPTSGFKADGVVVISCYLVFFLLCNEYESFKKANSGLSQADHVANKSLKKLDYIYKNDCTTTKELAHQIKSTQLELSKCENEILKLNKMIRRLDRKWKDNVATADEMQELTNLKVDEFEKQGEKKSIMARLKVWEAKNKGLSKDTQKHWEIVVDPRTQMLAELAESKKAKEKKMKLKEDPIDSQQWRKQTSLNVAGALLSRVDAQLRTQKAKDMFEATFKDSTPAVTREKAETGRGHTGTDDSMLFPDNTESKPVLSETTVSFFVASVGEEEEQPQQKKIEDGKSLHEGKDAAAIVISSESIEIEKKEEEKKAKKEDTILVKIEEIGAVVIVDNEKEDEQEVVTLDKEKERMGRQEVDKAIIVDILEEEKHETLQEVEEEMKTIEKLSEEEMEAGKLISIIQKLEEEEQRELTEKVEDMIKLIEQEDDYERNRTTEEKISEEVLEDLVPSHDMVISLEPVLKQVELAVIKLELSMELFEEETAEQSPMDLKYSTVTEVFNVLEFIPDDTFDVADGASIYEDFDILPFSDTALEEVPLLPTSLLVPFTPSSSSATEEKRKALLQQERTEFVFLKGCENLNEAKKEISAKYCTERFDVGDQSSKLYWKSILKQGRLENVLNKVPLVSDPWDALDSDPRLWLPRKTLMIVEKKHMVNALSIARRLRTEMFGRLLNEMKVCKYLKRIRERIHSAVFRIIKDHMIYSKENRLLNNAASRIQRNLRTFRRYRDFVGSLEKNKNMEAIGDAKYLLRLKKKKVLYFKFLFELAKMKSKYEYVLRNQRERLLIISFYRYLDAFKTANTQRLDKEYRQNSAALRIQMLIRCWVSRIRVRRKRAQLKFVTRCRMYLAMRTVRDYKTNTRRNVEYCKYYNENVTNANRLRDGFERWESVKKTKIGLQKIFSILTNKRTRRRFVKLKNIAQIYYEKRRAGIRIMQKTMRMFSVKISTLNYYKWRRGLRKLQGLVRRKLVLDDFYWVLRDFRAAQAIQKVIRGQMVRHEFFDSRIRAIHYTAAINNYSKLEYLANKYPELLHELDREGNTALHNAAKNASRRTLKLLLKKDLDPNMLNLAGYSPLHLIITSKATNRDDCCLYMLDRGFDMEIRDPDGKTCLLMACEQGRFVIVNYLLNAGQNPNTPDHYGVSCLQAACSRGYATIVRRLLEVGADTNMPGAHGTVPLHDVVNSGNMDIVNQLFSHGAYVNTYEPTNHQTPLMWACQSGNFRIVRSYLMQGADVEARDSNAWTALHYSVLSNDHEVFQALREADVDFDAVDHSGNSALHIAVQNNCVSYVLHLLEACAFPSIQNLEGNQPLHIAARNDNVECMNLLCKYDEFIGRVNFNHQTPLGIAKSWAAYYAVAYFEKWYVYLEPEISRDADGNLWWDKDIDAVADEWETEVDMDGHRVYASTASNELMDLPPAVPVEEVNKKMPPQLT